MKPNVVVLIIAWLLVALLAYAAIAKLADYSNFQFSISESPVIAPFASFLTWAVPGSELLIAVLLLVPRFRLAGLYASFILLALFTIYLSAMLVFAADIPCSCGGILEEMPWSMHIAFNMLFVLLGGRAIWLLRKQRKIPLT